MYRSTRSPLAPVRLRAFALLLVTLCLAATLPVARAATDTGKTLTLDSEPVSLQLGRHLGLYIDEQGRYSPAHLPPDELFTPSTSDIPSLGYSHSTRWARFRLHNASDGPLHLTLRQRYALIDDLTLIRVHGDGSVSTLRTGDTHPFAQRPIPQASFLLPADLAPGETSTFYLSYRSAGQVNIDLWLLNDAPLVAALEGENLLKGAYYGGMLALILYNLFLFLAIRDANYLRYVTYTSCYALLQISYNGVAFEYLWPNHPWWSNVSLNMIVCLTNLAMMNFARHFLEAPRRHPRLNRLGRGLEFINLGCVVASPLLPYQLISLSALSLALVGVTTILVMSIVSLGSGFKPARYFLTAWVTLLVGVVAAVLKGFGILPHNFLTEYGFQIGSYVEITLLSIALADRMQQLKLESITDVLTNTFNRRHFDSRCRAAFEQVRNREAVLSLVILDIDHFKQFNDRFGHEAGDRALVKVADTLNDVLRDSDELFRYGGEEFTVLLPGTSAGPARQIAERMRGAINDLEIEGQKLSISLGISTFDGGNCASPQEMLAQADTALYSAKAQGRNCVVHGEDIESI